MFEQNTYNENVKQFNKISSIEAKQFNKISSIEAKQFNKISSIEAKQLLSAENLTVVYIGRETCPYCRKFAKTLSALVPKINTPIYYVDSHNASDTEIHSFREEYDIVTVPGFIVGKNGNITVRCDSSTPESELLNMIQ